MKQIFLPLFLTISLFSGYSQTLKTITHEEMWMMKRVGAPALSPDGSWVVFSIQDPSYKEKEVVNDLWIAATDKSEVPRRLTGLQSGESAYSWSPDGKYLAFTAKRDGDEENQIYIINMKMGGEAQRFTNLSSGASSPKWRSDSKMILFTSNVYPNCYVDSIQKKKAEEVKNQKYKARVFESFPIRNWDKWLDEKQSHLYVQHLDSTKAVNLFKEVAMTKQPGFSLASFSWAGTDEVVFTATTQNNTTAYQYVQNHIYLLKITGGESKALTSGNVNYSSAIVSDDGKYLFCYENPLRYTVYDLNILVRYDFPSMAGRIELNKSLDRVVNNFEITEGDVLASIENHGRDELYSLFCYARPPRQVTIGLTGCYTNVTKRNGVIVCNYESLIMPPEIVLINPDGSHEFITNFNKDKLSKLDLKNGETFWTQTSRGKSIRSLLIKPAKFDSKKKYPLLVLMHGGPAISYKEAWGYRWHPHVIAGEEFVVVMTDYTGSTGYGEQFTQAIQSDPFKGPAMEINEAAADAIKRFNFIDQNRQAAGGASYGGHLANWMQASTSHYKCLIAHAGLVNSISQWGTSDGIYGREVMNGGVPWGQSKTWEEQNPMKFASKFKTPMLLTIGELDYRVPLNNTIESWHIHQRLKIPSKLIVFPEENHWILKAENSKFHYSEIRSWLKKWLLDI